MGVFAAWLIRQDWGGFIGLKRRVLLYSDPTAGPEAFLVAPGQSAKSRIDSCEKELMSGMVKQFSGGPTVG